MDRSRSKKPGRSPKLVHNLRDPWYQAAAAHGREDAVFNLQRLRAAKAPKGRMTHAFRAFEGLLAA